MGKLYRSACEVCGMIFTSRSSAKSAGSMRNRHRRETHGNKQVRMRVKELRLREDRLRKRAGRKKPATTEAAKDTLHEAVRLLVLCPRRREVEGSMYTTTRDHFLQLGLATHQIKRREGIDRSKNPEVRGFELVTKFVMGRFYEEAKKLLAEDPAVQFVWFAEDDCRVKPGIALSDIISACRNSSPGCVVWLGYGTRKGEPKVGAHLVSFSRGSLEAFRKDAKCRCHPTTKSFDTMLNCMWHDGLVTVPERSMAVQKRHAFKGRY